MFVRRWLLGVVIVVVGVPGLAIAQGSLGATPAAKPAPAVPIKRPVVKLAKPKVPTKDQLAAWTAALAGANLEAAAAAAKSLGEAAGAAAHEALLDALAMGLPPAVAVPAIEAVVMNAAPADVVSLVRYANHRNATVRSAALGALSKYPDPAAKRRIVLGLHDPATTVRGAAAAAAANGRVRDAVDSLLALLAKGEEPAARSLAALADPDLARKIADQLGKVPDPSLALCLGLILRRPDVADSQRVELVRAIAKIQHKAAIDVLADYVQATPKTPARPSRDEAEQVIGARTGGGK